MTNDIPEFVDPMDCPQRAPRLILARFGYTPIAPAELDDRQLRGRLWELLYAAAARRFFFDFTNHLDDRTFYTMLWDHWLDIPTADIPLAEETNTRWFLFEINDKTSEEIWLRYYAEESDREQWQADHPGAAIPPHENPPFDRDRFLPLPPMPIQARAGAVDDEAAAEPDPLGLANVDHEIAAAKADDPLDDDPFGPTDPELEEELRATEPENWDVPAKQLAKQHIPLLPPAELTDETLTPILWELLHNLSVRGFYVLHTDHLSDRELYAELWHHGLQEPACLPGRDSCSAWVHDILGSWGEEETQLWLRFYASEQERADHLTQWPQDTLPPKAKLPCKRDWRLPQGPFS